MKKNQSLKNLAVMWVMAILLILPQVVQAAPYGRAATHRGGGHGLMDLETLLELKLSDSQKLEILRLIEGYQKDRENARDRIREARKNLRTALQAGEFNESRVRQAYRESSSLQEELIVLKGKMMDDIGKVLNAEQKTLFKELRAKRMERMKEHARVRFEGKDQ